MFLGIGLGSVNALGVPGEDLPGVENAIDYIATLRQAEDKQSLPVGDQVVVVGGGMTAIDIAIQSKRLGASRVDIVYRRGPQQMSASAHEQELAQTNGVAIQHWAQPSRLLGEDAVTGIEFERTACDKNGQLVTTGETFRRDADVVFKAIGQRLDDDKLLDELAGLEIERGKIVVNELHATTIDGIWAGGDCVLGGDDLTVSAVQHGKVAAIAIDRRLRAA